MDTVLCPTRGGEASVPNQLKAVAIAKERGADLIFLHISNVQFLNTVASPILVDVEAELEEMGEFLMAMAQERAEQAGVHADTLVRQGVFRDALKEVIEERHVTVVVLGSSSEDKGITSKDLLLETARSILSETPVEVFIVREGEVIEHIQP